MSSDKKLDEVAIERMGLVQDSESMPGCYEHPDIGGWTFGHTLGMGESAYPNRPMPERILLQVWDAGVRLGNQQKANEIKHALGV